MIKKWTEVRIPEEKEIEEKYKSKVVDIRLYDKEFSYFHHFRIQMGHNQPYE